MNVGCPRRHWERAAGVLERALATSPEPVALLGHSRGGLLAKALTHRFDAQVEQLIVVGSPLGGMLGAGRHGIERFMEFMQGGDQAGLGVLQMNRQLSRMLDPACTAPLCDCEYMEALLAPLPAQLRTTSIFSPTDAVVPAVASALPGARNLQVSGSHAGLMVNAEVYRLLAEVLAETAVTGP